MARTTLISSSMALLVLGAGPAAGQSPQQNAHQHRWGVSGVVSTLGYGLELSGRVSRIVGLRGGYFLYTPTWENQEVEGITYDLKPRLHNGDLLVDIFPGGRWFRFSGGMLFFGTKVEADGVLTGPVEIGNATYTPSEVGGLTGKATWDKSVLPYLGIGVAAQTRFTVTFDIGIAFSGYPQVKLSANSPLTGAELAELEANLQAEQAQIQSSIEQRSWAKYYPVVSIGLKYRF